MTFLDTITRAEQEANNMRVDAQNDAARRAEQARAEQAHTLEAMHKNYSEWEEAKKNDAIRRADEEGTLLVEEGKKEIRDMQERAEENESDAVKFILENV